MYDFKSLPPAPEEQFEIPPRDRIIPSHQKPKAPKELKIGQAPRPKDEFTHKDNDKSQPKSFGNYRNKGNEGSIKGSKHRAKKTDNKNDGSSVNPYANSPK